MKMIILILIWLVLCILEYKAQDTISIYDIIKHTHKNINKNFDSISDYSISYLSHLSFNNLDSTRTKFKKFNSKYIIREKNDLRIIENIDTDSVQTKIVVLNYFRYNILIIYNNYENSDIKPDKVYWVSDLFVSHGFYVIDLTYKLFYFVKTDVIFREDFPKKYLFTGYIFLLNKDLSTKSCIYVYRDKITLKYQLNSNNELQIFGHTPEKSHKISPYLTKTSFDYMSHYLIFNIFFNDVILNPKIEYSPVDCIFDE